MENWNELRVFLAIARHGTLTKASEALNVSVSTMHRRLAGLEESVGVQLFEKGPRGYRLTPAGEALFPRTEEVEEAINVATRTVVGHDQQVSGEVRITLPPVILPFFAEYLSAFCMHEPGVQLVIQAADARLDLERETDIAIRATTNPVDTAIGRKLCGVAWGHFASARTDTGDLPWVHYGGSEPSIAIEWRRKRFGDVKPMMTVQRVSAMQAVLGASGGQGALPCFIGDADPTLRRVGEPFAMNTLWLLVHADLRRSARVRAVIDFLVPQILADRDRLEGVRPG